MVPFFKTDRSRPLRTRNCTGPWLFIRGKVPNGILHTYPSPISTRSKALGPGERPCWYTRYGVCAPLRTRATRRHLRTLRYERFARAIGEKTQQRATPSGIRLRCCCENENGSRGEQSLDASTVIALDTLTLCDHYTVVDVSTSKRQLPGQAQQSKNPPSPPRGMGRHRLTRVVLNLFVAVAIRKVDASGIPPGRCPLSNTMSVGGTWSAGRKTPC